MRITLPGLRTALASAALGLLAAAGPARAAVSYQDYHSFAAVERQLQEWSAAHPREMKLIAIGKSAGGRTLWVARVAAPGGNDPDQRPAVFVGGNIAGFHNAGTEAALDLLRGLLEPGSAAADSAAAKLLATTTFYVAPALNPDAHDGIFAKLRVRRGGNDQKIDHDRDGLVGEDPPDDLNGDGMITRMRIADPTGGWLPDATDPRVLIKADAMEQRAGAYRMEIEGKDDDGDGPTTRTGRTGSGRTRTSPTPSPTPPPRPACGRATRRRPRR